MEAIVLVELIPQDKLIELKPAADVKVIANSAKQVLELQSVAHVINTAANCGEHRVSWNHALSESIITELENNGYVVRPKYHTAYPNITWIIEGF